MKQEYPPTIPLNETGVHPPPPWMKQIYPYHPFDEMHDPLLPPIGWNMGMNLNIVLCKWRQDHLRPTLQGLPFIAIFGNF